MSLTWLKSWVSTEQEIGMKSDSVVVCESLLMELDAQMAEAEAEKRETDELIRRRNNPGMADYRWLVSTPPKSYEMPQLERLELETICMKIKPSESGRVITSFRESLIRQPAIPDIPRILRAIVIQVLETRVQEETMPQWVMKSLTRLRPSSSTRVTPLNENPDAVTRLDELPV